MTKNQRDRDPYIRFELQKVYFLLDLKKRAKNSITLCVISLPGIDSCSVETGHDPGPTWGEGHGQPDGDVVRGRVPLVLSRKQRIYFLTDKGEHLTRVGLITTVDLPQSLGYSDFHNLMGFTSKKMPNNIL